MDIPEIRVFLSHQIKRSIPEPIHKNAKDLLNHEKIIYYVRMSFIIRIILQILKKYEAEKHLSQMKILPEYSLTEQQFVQLLGKTRLYQHLPKKEKEKLQIPELTFNDSQFTTIAKDYYQDESFCRNEDNSINLWKVYNLFTQSNKSSYIDTFLNRTVNALDFTQNIQKTMVDKSYHWFLG